MQFEFIKMHGTGNDFIMIDNRDLHFPTLDDTLIRYLCRFHTGIGADGLILLENSVSADFRMRYYNSDGFESDMCVNGSRCTCFFAKILGIIKTRFTFEAGDGVHFGEISGKNQVRVEVKLKRDVENRTFPVDFKLPKSISFINFLNTGVPHLVLACGDIDNLPLEELGKTLRFHSYYAPEGTNVNFVSYESSVEPFSLKVRTYERGVDAETLSCGSGVTASAISFRDKYMPGAVEIPVQTCGGRVIVSFKEDEEKIFLDGPVRVVFEGTYIDEEDIL